MKKEEVIKLQTRKYVDGGSNIGLGNNHVNKNNNSDIKNNSDYTKVSSVMILVIVKTKMIISC